ITCNKALVLTHHNNNWQQQILLGGRTGHLKNLYIKYMYMPLKYLWLICLAKIISMCF
ncbi:hypothetical protein ACJX0J_010568, partial [Zea mays]